MTEATTDPGRQASATSAPESSDFSGGYTPFRIDTTGTPLDEGPRVPLFYVNGPDGEREFTIPEHIPARYAIKALRVAATQGRDAAMWFLVENALTPEAIHELTEGEASRFVEREQVRAMLTELGRRYYGQAEEAWGAGK